MNPTCTNPEELFNRIVDGIASDADEQQLAEWLRSDPDMRRAYREFMELHAALQWDYVTALSLNLPNSMAAVEPNEPGAPRRSWFTPFVAGTIAASFLVAAVLWLINPWSNTERSKDAPKADSIAALLVDEVGAEFAEGRAPDGVRFAAGEYELVKGIVHLRFAQGADMVLASPARLEVTDAQHVRLRYGKVRVTASPMAKGFTIATHGTDYVDLGTEFGLSVDRASGVTDLYVFDGQVNVADQRSGEILSEVMQGGSSRVVGGEIGPAPQLEEDAFPTPGTIGFQRWQNYETELLKSHGLLAFFPFRRTANENLLVNGHSEPLVAAGRINGAHWTTGRWQGKEALLFDHDTDFVQLDIPGEFQELTIAVWLKIDRFDHVFSAILNSDGHDLGDVHFQLTRQGFPRGGVILDGNYKDHVIGNQVPEGVWTHVVSVLSTRTRSQQIYVNGNLTRERRWPKDEVLRPGKCRLGNWLSTGNVPPANRALRGRVDELAIWNRALPEDEVKQLFESGRPKPLMIEK